METASEKNADCGFADMRIWPKNADKCGYADADNFKNF